MEQLITYNCEWCGEEHTQKLGNYNRNELHFCSTSCGTNYRWKEQKKINEDKLKKVTVCACGCGTIIPMWKKIQNSGGYRRFKFIHGHNGIIPNSGQFQKDSSSWNAGLTKETDERLDFVRPACFQKGRELSEEEKIKVSCGLRGISIEDFDGFVIDDDPRKNRKERDAHSEWRSKIFQRDNYACQLCGIKSGCGHKILIQAHHIKHWKDYPELRRELSNGVTLCKDCHNYAHSKKYKLELEEK